MRRRASASGFRRLRASTSTRASKAADKSGDARERRTTSSDAREVSEVEGAGDLARKLVSTPPSAMSSELCSTGEFISPPVPQPDGVQVAAFSSVARSSGIGWILLPSAPLALRQWKWTRQRHQLRLVVRADRSNLQHLAFAKTTSFGQEALRSAAGDRIASPRCLRRLSRAFGEWLDKADSASAIRRETLLAWGELRRPTRTKTRELPNVRTSRWPRRKSVVPAAGRVALCRSLDMHACVVSLPLRLRP